MKARNVCESLKGSVANWLETKCLDSKYVLLVEHFAYSFFKLCNLDTGKIKQEQKKLQDSRSYIDYEGGQWDPWGGFRLWACKILQQPVI